METTLLTIEQMHDRYPNQWLLVVCHEMDEQMEVVAGEVIASSTNRDDIYDAIAQARKTRNSGTLSIEYTGQIPDNAAFIL